jgi:gluconokinase
MDRPVVIALDLASGGATAALVTPELAVHSVFESPWTLVDHGAGSYGLAPGAVLDHVAEAIRLACSDQPEPDAIVLASMMHTLLLAGPDGAPRGPIRTWRDRGPLPDSRLMGSPSAYRQRTGCYIHPSFPASKLLQLRRSGSAELRAGFRIESMKSFVQRHLTGESAEDVSTASASGLLDLDTGGWDPATLDALDIDISGLPPVVGTGTILGGLASRAAAWTGLAHGIPVVAGIGDGFAATIGSGCTPGGSVSVTLGTTSSVRKVVPTPHRRPDGTFCYRFAGDRFLVGCSSSNGGNLLDWERSALPPAPDPHPGNGETEGGVPVFMPFLGGERSPFWDAGLEARWVGVDRTRTTEELRAAVVESTVFLIRYAYERVVGDGPRPRSAVISGNGFRRRDLGSVLAGLVDIPIVEPDEPGLATIRGAASVGFDALGIDTKRAVESLVEKARTIAPAPDHGVHERFGRFHAHMADIESGSSDRFRGLLSAPRPFTAGDRRIADQSSRRG